MDMFKFFNRLMGSKYYKHYISLGYNCEFAIRFYKKYQFVESSLFTWTNSIKIEKLIYALENLDLILKEDPEAAGVMWRCINTDIRFHGTEPHEIQEHKEKYSNEELKPYKKELCSRISHLKSKFINQISDGRKILITYTYRAHHEKKETCLDVFNNIKKLKNSLDNIDAKNYHLLIILQKSDKIHIEDASLKRDNIFIRYVNEFAPEEDVVNGQYDKKSWNRIFKEFKPDFKLAKTKKFKFEEL